MFELLLLGQDTLDTELTQLAEDLDDPEPFLKGDAAVIAGLAIRRNFEEGGRPDPWPDITAKSRAARKADKTSSPELDTRALENAASATEPGVDGSLFDVSGDTLTMGTDLSYAAAQNFGREDINLPAREFENLLPEDEVRLARAFDDDYLHRLLRSLS